MTADAQVEALLRELGGLLEPAPVPPLVYFEHGMLVYDAGLRGWKTADKVRDDFEPAQLLEMLRTYHAEPALWAAVVAAAQQLGRQDPPVIGTRKAATILGVSTETLERHIQHAPDRPKNAGSKARARWWWQSRVELVTWWKACPPPPAEKGSASTRRPAYQTRSKVKAGSRKKPSLLARAKATQR